MAETWAGLTKRILHNSLVKQVPVAGAFELTARCNFQCKMCYVCRKINDTEAIGMELPADDWIRIGREARDAGLLFLTLTGGEVFARKDFPKIYDALAQMGLRIVIYTNGSMITPEIASWLKTAPPAMVSITLYGASSETYEKVTGSAAGFKNTIRGIEALKAEGIIVGIKTTVVQGNHKEFDQINTIARRYSAGLGLVDYISPRREGDNTDPEGNRLPPEEIVKYTKTAMEYNNRTSSKEEKIDMNKDTMTELPVETIEGLDKTDPFQCYAGKAGFWVTWDGRLTPCGLLNIPEESLLKNSFSKAWSGLKLQCRKVPNCQDCIECSIRNACNTCPARLMSETGAFDKKAAYLCELAKYNSLQMKSI